ncbi:hypothetical protein DL771_005972 [Monosporascus sp. 5C6A]|nr:hypothetical protein DL771_005972 [Monosporascus sp. 5C6A]
MSSDPARLIKPIDDLEIIADRHEFAFRDLDSVSVGQRARFALAHDRDVEEAAQDLRRLSVFAHPGYKSSRSL